jgi:hypothetical protein
MFEHQDARAEVAAKPLPGSGPSVDSPEEGPVAS